MRECCKDGDATQWGKWKIRPVATPKLLNRSSPKVAHVIWSWTSTHMQYLVTICQGISFPRMREIAHPKCLLEFFFSGFFQQPTAQAPEPIFTQNTANDVVPRKDVPFRGYKTKFNIQSPLFPTNCHFWPAFHGTFLTENFRPKTALQWVLLHVNSP